MLRVSELQVNVAKIKRSAKSKKGECGFSSPEPDNPDSSGSEGTFCDICFSFQLNAAYTSAFFLLLWMKEVLGRTWDQINYFWPCAHKKILC